MTLSLDCPEPFDEPVEDPGQVGAREREDEEKRWRPVAGHTRTFRG